MVRVRRGIYRLVHFPASEHEDLVVLWLWAEQAGVFSHETALALHDLSDALPGKVHLTVPASWRRRRLRVPAGLVLHFADVGDVDRASFGGARHGAAPDPARLHRGQRRRRPRTARDPPGASARRSFPRRMKLGFAASLAPRADGSRAMTARQYATPLAFKQALEQRLKSVVGYRRRLRSAPPVARLRSLPRSPGPSRWRRRHSQGRARSRTSPRSGADDQGHRPSSDGLVRRRAGDCSRKQAGSTSATTCCSRSSQMRITPRSRTRGCATTASAIAPSADSRA